MSNNEQSIAMHAQWRSSTEKFDYFVLAATGALCAFISQTYTPERIDLSPATVELASLILFILSGAFGFARIEALTVAWASNYHELHLFEENTKLREAADQAEEKKKNIGAATSGVTMSAADVRSIVKNNESLIEGIVAKGKLYEDRGHFCYKWRNYLLVAGIVTLLAARIWKPYFIPPA